MPLDHQSAMHVDCMRSCMTQAGHWKWGKTLYRREKGNNLHKAEEEEAKTKLKVSFFPHLTKKWLFLLIKAYRKGDFARFSIISGSEQTQSKSVPRSGVPPFQPVSSKSVLSKQNFQPKDFPSHKVFSEERAGKVFITDAEAQEGIAPQDISLGMRSYSCSSEECKNLHFGSFEGPNSVKEHIAIHHKNKMWLLYIIFSFKLL